MPHDERVCAHCVCDSHLSAAIGRSEIADQECDYCQVTRPTIEAGAVAEACDKVIEKRFDLADGESSDWGYDLQGESTEQLLGRIVSTNGELVDDCRGQAFSDGPIRER